MMANPFKKIWPWVGAVAGGGNNFYHMYPPPDMFYLITSTRTYIYITVEGMFWGFFIGLGVSAVIAYVLEIKNKIEVEKQDG